MHRHNNSLNLCLKNFLLVTTFNLLYLELPHYIQPVRTLMTLNHITFPSLSYTFNTH